jgi:hypothetical protein
VAYEYDRFVTKQNKKMNQTFFSCGAYGNVLENNPKIMN